MQSRSDGAQTVDGMDSTISVSKGCFVFKNGATRAGGTKKTAATSPSKRRRTTTAAIPSPLDKSVTGQPFYSVYAATWRRLETEIESLQRDNYSHTLESLMEYVASTHSSSDADESMSGDEADDDASADFFDSADNEMLPTAVLLTGINQTDHLQQFETLAANIRSRLAACVCTLMSRDCGSLKTALETLVYNFVETTTGAADEVERHCKRLRRSHCTIKALKRWYTNNFPNTSRPSRREREESDGQEGDEEEEDVESADSADEPPGRHKRAGKPSQGLVVILPDFECFAAHVLQDLILILSSHRAELPFSLVLGVATNASAVHAYLPYHVTSKIRVRVFKTQPSAEALNEILERVILSPRNVFLLSGKAFKFLTHIFLYYDFSISGFIQGYKYCLMEHFFQGNAYALCTTYTDSLKQIPLLGRDDLETIRRLLSFRPYVEAINDCQRIIAILTDDDYLKRKLPQLLSACHVHFLVRRVILEFLAELVGDLPKSPLGRLRRELYTICWTKEITAQPEFRECWQLLALLSKEEFLAKMNRAIDATLEYLVRQLKGIELATDCVLVVNEKIVQVKRQLAAIQTAGTRHQSHAAAGGPSPERLKDIGSRQQLKERLLQMSKQERPITEFAQHVTALLGYIETEIVRVHLPPLQRAPPLHELFVFSDITTVRRNIIGAPRAALHVALNNPHFYLQCKCCHLGDEPQRMLPSLPDLSVAYKLHLECGRMINLFDWLQAFRSVVESEEEAGAGAQDQIDPQIQARFTRAIAELQYLGYIKMSKRKMDHATRLTW